MLSLFDEGGYAPCPNPFNFAAHVLRHAPSRPDKIALAVLGPARAERWSYAKIEAAVRGTATGLLRLGLQKGDRILMRLGNTPDFPILYLGAIAAGLIPCPTSAMLTGPEITGMAATLKPTLVVAAPDIAVPDGYETLGLEDLREFYDLPPADYAMGDPDRPAYIIFTSGTSGKPRAVVHAHRAIWARQMMIKGWYDLGESDRLLHAGAFNWTYTLGTGLMDPWSMGATALIPAAGMKAEALPLLLKRHDATIFAAAPGVYRQLLRAPIQAMPKLRHGLTAGEKLPESLRVQWQDATGTSLHEAFGMSEISTFLSGSPARPAPQGALGYPQTGRRVAILSDGVPVPRGTSGQIAVHKDDPGLMLGYLDHAEETRARFDGDWFLTGDEGYMSEDGAIFYAGRNDDMLNAGGYRVSPIEVESALSQHPAISEVGACEVTVKEGTSVIAAFYVGTEDLGDTLADFAAQRLARYKCPRIFERVDELPRGANNKLLRKVLRKNWETAHGQT